MTATKIIGQIKKLRLGESARLKGRRVVRKRAWGPGLYSRVLSILMGQLLGELQKTNH